MKYLETIGKSCEPYSYKKSGWMMISSGVVLFLAVLNTSGFANHLGDGAPTSDRVQSSKSLEVSPLEFRYAGDQSKAPFRYLEAEKKFEVLHPCVKTQAEKIMSLLKTDKDVQDGLAQISKDIGPAKLIPQLLISPDQAPKSPRKDTRFCEIGDFYLVLKAVWPERSDLDPVYPKTWRGIQKWNEDSSAQDVAKTLENIQKDYLRFVDAREKHLQRKKENSKKSNVTN